MSPIPTPSKDEEKDTFMGRCMSMMKGDFPDNAQRAAVCLSKWRKMRGGEKPETKPTEKEEKK